MKLVYRRCAGLDVHQKSVSVCVRKRVRGNPEAEVEEAVFGTFTQDLERLAKWLKEHEVKQVAMESTGVYWIPVWNVLERAKYRLQLTLVNPAVVRALQGRKTDRIDARRIAEYLQYGLLRGSFIPPKPVRQQRELTRMRVHVQQDRNRVINRMVSGLPVGVCCANIGRLLETANIKLGSVASHIAGKSGRVMLQLLSEGKCDPERLADKALGHLRKKIPDLILALDGRTDEHFRWVLSRLLAKLEGLDRELAELNQRLESALADQSELLDRLCTIPGIEKTTAQTLLAELGTDMTQFPSAAHAASWAGLCPGNAESAGKRFSGRTRKGNRYLRRALVQSAWAAGRTKDCFFAALFQRIALRRGPKKAAVAVAHRLLQIVYNIIRSGEVYRERGGDFFDKRSPVKTAKRLAKRLERIGFEVTLVPRPLPDPTEKIVVSADICSQCHGWRLPACLHARNQPKKQTSRLSSADSIS